MVVVRGSCVCQDVSDLIHAVLSSQLQAAIVVSDGMVLFVALSLLGMQCDRKML
jgi:hypothetical protein